MIYVTLAVVIPQAIKVCMSIWRAGRVRMLPTKWKEDGNRNGKVLKKSISTLTTALNPSPGVFPFFSFGVSAPLSQRRTISRCFPFWAQSNLSHSVGPVWRCFPTFRPHRTLTRQRTRCPVYFPPLCSASLVQITLPISCLQYYHKIIITD